MLLERIKSVLMKQAFVDIRNRTEAICSLLTKEDHVVQPVVDVSPPKWHLAHTTWFFEAFVLQDFIKEYKPFNPQFFYLFNSYYEGMGERVGREQRGAMSRPGVEEILAYRAYVDEQMKAALNSGTLPQEALRRVWIGLNHEQQHQELLLTDIKFILGNQPLLPEYHKDFVEFQTLPKESGMLDIEEGLYSIGHSGEGFAFDNEKLAHKVWLDDFSIALRPVHQLEYLEFIDDGGYLNHRLWLAEGWDLVQHQGLKAPLHWHWNTEEGRWLYYSLAGLKPLNAQYPVAHLSYYEAEAYARWAGKRLPKETEWEVAARLFPQHFPLHGWVWEWTQSAYLPYPGFEVDAGALGEYNGKFMSGQMVLRGGSAATPEGHSRITYRNFFHPHLRWQFSGLRLAQ